MKFGITNDFGSAKADIKGTDNSIELLKLDGDEFVVLLHTKESPFELGVYSKKELETLWRIMSKNK